MHTPNYIYIYIYVCVLRDPVRERFSIYARLSDRVAVNSNNVPRDNLRRRK